jgi:predicted dehydrogenase
MEKLRVSVIGAGGMAGRHLKRLLELENYAVVAVAEVNFDRKDVQECLSLAKGAGVKIFRDYHEMLDKIKTEAVFVGTPHYLHQSMVEDVLRHGQHVFCEKPPAPTVEACKRMLKAQKRYGHIVAIGFHHLGHTNAQWLKKFISCGGLGKVREVVALLSSYRPDSYYERSPWVGKMKVGSEWCLDGVLLNQMAHFINQSMFFASHEAAPHILPVIPGTTIASLYKVRDTPALEMEDLGIFRCHLEGGVNFFCVATTALEGSGNLFIEVVGEKGKAIYDNCVKIWIKGEAPVIYDEPDTPDYLYKNFYQAIREGIAPLSPLEEAVKCVYVLESVFKAADYRIKKISCGDYVKLRELIFRSTENRCLFWELPDPPDWSFPFQDK